MTHLIDAYEEYIRLLHEEIEILTSHAIGCVIDYRYDEIRKKIDHFKLTLFNDGR